MNFFSLSEIFVSREKSIKISLQQIKIGPRAIKGALVGHIFPTAINSWFGMHPWGHNLSMIAFQTMTLISLELCQHSKEGESNPNMVDTLYNMGHSHIWILKTSPWFFYYSHLFSSQHLQIPTMATKLYSKRKKNITKIFSQANQKAINSRRTYWYVNISMWLISLLPGIPAKCSFWNQIHQFHFLFW